MPQRRISSDEQQLIEALKEPQLLNAPVERLKEALRVAMVKVGLRAANWPKDEEKLLLIKHILENYGGHTADEIGIAFDMALAGKLNLPHSEVVCYENFSCLYFSTIMNAYRDWSEQAYKENVKEPVMIEHKEDISDVAMQDWYNTIAADYKKGVLTQIEFLPIMLFDWLSRKEKIGGYEPYLLLAAKRIGKRLREKSMDQKGIEELNKYLAMYKSGEFSGHFVGEINSLAKRMALHDHILKSNDYSTDNQSGPENS